MRDIMPCPFCGKKVKLWTRKGKTKYTIGCKNIDCFLYIPSDVDLESLHTYAVCYRLLADLLKAWNKRMPNAKAKK